MNLILDHHEEQHTTEVFQIHLQQQPCSLSLFKFTSFEGMLWGICQHILKALSRGKTREKSIFKHEIKPESQNIDLTGPRKMV